MRPSSQTSRSLLDQCPPLPSWTPTICPSPRAGKRNGLVLFPCPTISPKAMLAHSLPSASPYQCEALGWGCPALDCGEWPLLQHFLGLFIHAHHRVLGDPQQARHQLVLAFHLFLKQEVPRVSALPLNTSDFSKLPVISWCFTYGQPTTLCFENRQGYRKTRILRLDKWLIN